MKARQIGLVLVIGLMSFSSMVWAQPAGPPPAFSGHYPVGVEGIKGGSLPPPGMYFRFYNLFYYSEHERIKDIPDGTDFEVFAYAAAPRLIWISDYKVLGGNYGADILVPFAYVDWDIDLPPGLGTPNDSYFGLGDIFVEPITLSWHPKQFDIGIGYGFWAPTGEDVEEPGLPVETRPALLWKGFWSHMFTLGGTWFPDKEKTWAISLLNRYEIHHEHENFPITPGHTLSMEWGISKTFRKTIDVGAVGYYQQQTTSDHGQGASPYKDRILSAGPEVSVVWPKVGLISSLRYLREFGSKDRPEGNLVTLTLTKPF